MKHTSVFSSMHLLFFERLENVCIVIMLSDVILLSGTTSLKTEQVAAVRVYLFYFVSKRE